MNFLKITLLSLTLIMSVHVKPYYEGSTRALRHFGTIQLSNSNGYSCYTVERVVPVRLWVDTCLMEQTIEVRRSSDHLYSGDEHVKYNHYDPAERKSYDSHSHTKLSPEEAKLLYWKLEARKKKQDAALLEAQQNTEKPSSATV